MNLLIGTHPAHPNSAPPPRWRTVPSNETLINLQAQHRFEQGAPHLLRAPPPRAFGESMSGLSVFDRVFKTLGSYERPGLGNALSALYPKTGPATDDSAALPATGQPSQVIASGQTRRCCAP